MNKGDAMAVELIRVVLTSGSASMVLLNSEEACQVELAAVVLATVELSRASRPRLPVMDRVRLVRAGQACGAEQEHDVITDTSRRDQVAAGVAPEGQQPAVL